MTPKSHCPAPSLQTGLLLGAGLRQGGAGPSAPGTPGSPHLCRGSWLPRDPRQVVERLQVNLGATPHLALRARRGRPGGGAAHLQNLLRGVLIELKLDFCSD